jgi:deazaflavin-dependent oxidoreductase (nitroreductase family)
MLRLHTLGRRSGRPRFAILGFFEDGPNLVTLAMNGWAAPEPAWWLNLQAHPEASVDLTDGSRPVVGRAATGGNGNGFGRGGAR